MTLFFKARYISKQVENCDVDVPYICKNLDVDELNVNAEPLGLSNNVSCLSLNCRSNTASNHFQLIVILLQIIFN